MRKHAKCVLLFKNDIFRSFPIYLFLIQKTKPNYNLISQHCTNGQRIPTHNQGTLSTPASLATVSIAILAMPIAKSKLIRLDVSVQS